MAVAQGLSFSYLPELHPLTESPAMRAPRASALMGEPPWPMTCPDLF